MPKRRQSTLCLLTLPLTTAFLTPRPSHTRSTSLHGLSEWREEALSTHYTLAAYQQSNPQPTQPIGTVPILPFPFSEILLPGQTKQSNLYEERFHLLFQEALDNHSVVGMGLLAGTGMMTLLPLLEIESYTRLGYDDNWQPNGDGMGNGSIFVTVRAVGRAKVIDELEQEEPFLKARVVEVIDEGGINGVGMVKEKSGDVEGEASPMEVGSLIAGNIETLILSVSSMEHRYNEWREEMERKRGDKMSAIIEDEDGNKISRSALNAQLEALFKEDTLEGMNIPTTNLEPEDDKDDTLLDRRSRYYTAFEEAKLSDTQGYVTPTIDPTKPTIRTLKDLTAISWAVFCTTDPESIAETEADEIQTNVFKIQALDMTNVVQRLNLGAAMLRMEKKKLKAKLALVEKGGERSEEELG